MKRPERIQNLLRQLSAGLVEREEPLRLVFLCAMAGEGMFLLGPPGVGKSLIARRLKYAFKGGSSFEYLMHRFSTPEEIFGPISVSKLKNEDKYERNVEGYLPAATVVFLDEIWKAGPSIQNTLLTVLNERLFRNGSQEIRVPMKAFIAASNELPAKGEGLEALWDRFLVRYLVEGIKDSSAFNRMLDSTDDLYADCVDEELKISSEEYEAWSKEINLVKVSPDVFTIIDKIRKSVQHEINESSDSENRLYISDRRWKKIIRLLKTAAFLEGREEVDFMDCQLIKHCIWDTPEQISDVNRIVEEAIQSSALLDAEAKIGEIGKEVEALYEDIRKNIYTLRTRSVVNKFYLKMDHNNLNFYRSAFPLMNDTYYFIEQSIAEGLEEDSRKSFETYVVKYKDIQGRCRTYIFVSDKIINDFSPQNVRLDPKVWVMIEPIIGSTIILRKNKNRILIGSLDGKEKEIYILGMNIEEVTEYKSPPQRDALEKWRGESLRLGKALQALSHELDSMTGNRTSLFAQIPWYLARRIPDLKKKIEDVSGSLVRARKEYEEFVPYNEPKVVDKKLKGLVAIDLAKKIIAEVEDEVEEDMLSKSVKESIRKYKDNDTNLKQDQHNEKPKPKSRLKQQ